MVAPALYRAAAMAQVHHCPTTRHNRTNDAENLGLCRLPGPASEATRLGSTASSASMHRRKGLNRRIPMLLATVSNHGGSRNPALRAPTAPALMVGGQPGAKPGLRGSAYPAESQYSVSDGRTAKHVQCQPDQPTRAITGTTLTGTSVPVMASARILPRICSGHRPPADRRPARHHESRLADGDTRRSFATARGRGWRVGDGG